MTKYLTVFKYHLLTALPLSSGVGIALPVLHTWAQETKSSWMETDPLHVSLMLYIVSSVYNYCSITQGLTVQSWDQTDTYLYVGVLSFSIP